MSNLVNIARIIALPFEKNKVFAFFMITLFFYTNYVCCTAYRDPHLHAKVWAEAIIDLFLICIFLILLPIKIREFIKSIIYLFAYSLSIIECYCVINFSSTINPSILQLLSETNSREASDFISTFITLRTFISPLTIIGIIGIINISVLLIKRYGITYRIKSSLLSYCITLLLLCSIIRGGYTWANNKLSFYNIMTSKTIGEVENTILNSVTTHDYNDILGGVNSRLLYSIKVISLISKQAENIRKAGESIKITCVGEQSTNIVLIIGESYNKHHSQLYGYHLPTTPNQKKWEEEKNLIRFDDVVTTWDLTSQSFKNMMTTYCIGDSGEWCDYPLIGSIMKKANYNVTFITNQFIPNNDNSICGISGGFFLNDKDLSQQQFDYRNKEDFEFDGDLITSYFKNDKNSNNKKFTIFHLLGQHFTYSMRSPQKWKVFSLADCKRKDLPLKDQNILIDYDNSILYNDYVLSLIIDYYKNTDAVIIYLSDHAERVYGPGNGKLYGRQTFEEIDKNNAIENFEIPMWIYVTDRFKMNHPKYYAQIHNSSKHPFMTDALPNLIMHLAGISTHSYNPSNDLLSNRYNTKRPRLLRKEVDYDKLR